MSALGHKADIAARLNDVRFTPKSGHWNRHVCVSLSTQQLRQLGDIRRDPPRHW
jgi:hypothetical protein